MVSFTCPCWGRGAGEAVDCTLAVEAPEVKVFGPGVEETVLGAETAVETGWPLMICVTTCCGAPGWTITGVRIIAFPSVDCCSGVLITVIPGRI